MECTIGVSLVAARERVAIYSEFRAPQLRDSSLGDLLETLRHSGIASATVVDALRYWVACASERVTGDATARALTFKLLVDNTGRRAAKAYLGALGLVP